MASTCIIRQKRGQYLYGTDDNKPTIQLRRGESLPELTVEGVGAPDMCPECVVRHTVLGTRSVDSWVPRLDALLSRVRAEVAGTAQAASTEARYVKAVDELLHRVGTHPAEFAGAV